VRAAAVVAAERLSREAGSAFTAAQLSAYLCSLSEPQQELHESLTYHLTPGLVSY
jgi:hypothetical protein